MKKLNQSNEWSNVLLACLLPLAYTLFWLIRNNQLPGNDAANYLMTAIDIHQHFTDHSVWNGLKQLFFLRGWRPILFPVLPVPFLLLSHGNLYFAYSAVAIICLLVSIIYLYLFFRLSLAPRSAIIAANLVGLLPLFQAQLVMFYAEGALFPCIIATLYHLIKADYFQERRHSIGFIVWLSLAVMVRPVEAVTHLIFVLIFFFSLGWRQKIFTLQQIITVVSLAMTVVVLIFSVAWISYSHQQPVAMDTKMVHTAYVAMIASAIVSIFCWMLALIGWRKASQKNRLVSVFAMAFGIILLWFLPFALETFEWVYRTSLGDVASSTGSLTGSRFSFEVLHIYIRAEGTMILATMSLLTLISLLQLRKEQIKKIILSLPFIFLLLMLPFPLWEAFYTVQIVTRKLSIVFPAFVMAMLLVSLQEGKGWRFRNIIVALLSILQFTLAIYLFYSKTYRAHNAILENTIGYFVPQPIDLKPNPHDVLIHFLNSNAEKYHLKSIGLEVNPGTPDARHFVESEPVDPFLISTMVMAGKRSYSTSYPYESQYQTDNVKNLTSRYDALFLSDSVNTMKISSEATNAYRENYFHETSPSLKTFYELLMNYADNQLEKVGWKLGPCIVIQSVGYGDYQGCLLLPHNPP